MHCLIFNKDFSLQIKQSCSLLLSFQWKSLKIKQVVLPKVNKKSAKKNKQDTLPIFMQT